MSHDVLAGLLPAGNPLAPFDATAMPASQPGLPEEIATLAHPAQPVSLDHLAALSEASAPRAAVSSGSSITLDPSVTPSPAPVVGRRRRSRTGPWIAGFTVVVCAAIGVCVYLLVSGVGISQHGELVAVRPSAGKAPATVAPEGAAAPSAAAEAPVSAMATPESTNPEPTHSEPTHSEPTHPEPTHSEPATSEPIVAERSEGPATETASGAEPDRKTSAEGPSPLQRSMEVMRSGAFGEMSASAAEARRLATTPELRRLADGMQQLADLTDYYIEGIRRGSAGLGAAETFEIVPGVPVVVVESSRDAIALKINGRVKSYSLESMPLVLAHRLTRFSLPADDPVVKAAAGAYQALWPQATDAHRRQAFQWWRDLEEMAGDAKFSQLEPTVREIFGMPNE